MTRRPAYMTRQQYVRTDGNLLQNTPEGWVTDVGTHGNIRWGDYPSAPRPSWWMGRDEHDWGPIGPNGPNLATNSILPAVTRATEVICNTITRTAWRYTGPDGEIVARPLWVDDPMLIGRAPGPIAPVVPAGLRLDGHSFFASWLTHAIWWGLGAFVCVEAADGTPLPGTLRLVNPFMVGRGDDGHWVIDPHGDTPVRTTEDGRFILGGRVWRLVTLRGMGPNDSQTPEGVLTRHFQTFRLGATVSEYVASTFVSGVPAGYLKVSTPNMQQPEADALKASWMGAHGKGRRSIAVLSSTVDFQPISISPVDSDAANMVRGVRTDVAHAFNLSNIWMDEGTSGLTYQNNSDRRRDLVDISLSGWSERMMAVLSSLLPYGQRVDVDWQRFTTPSITEHMPALVAGVQTGILTAGEARQYLGLERATGPDPAWVDRSPAVSEPAPEPEPVPEPLAITATEETP